MLRNTFLMCGIASLVLGLYSLTLPKTPPAADRTAHPGLRDVLGLEALRLLANRNFLIFFAASILICIPLAFYYQNANLFLTETQLTHASGKQTIGQASQVLFMLSIAACAGFLSWMRRATFNFN